ncbi:hypothetical protein IPA_06330 [Ignicoccus pacificus DSM 13166]|uniref:Uncharacterized protein n=1 Tax=Ignicoccus pacificus DSM 13166 TaxID=940294 RepID=A0A977KCQ7_9CREN|nr:hypothetical protein IPA_06330 [Ignicoccus pacificus DSM 13166]
MSGSSEQRKRFSETCLSSCEPLAYGEESLIVTRDKTEKCEKACGPLVGEKRGAFIELRPLSELPSFSLETAVLTLFLFGIMAYSFAYSFSKGTNYTVLQALYMFLAGSLIPLAIQAISALVIGMSLGVFFDLYLFPAPSILPGILPSFVPTRAFKSMKEHSYAYSIPLLIGVLSAIALAYWSQSAFQVVITRPSGNTMKLIPEGFSLLQGAANPLTLGALAYMLSAFFQCSFYTFSPSWGALGIRKRLWWLPVALWLVVFSYDSLLGVLTLGYALTAVLLSLYFLPTPFVRDPTEGPSPVALVVLLIAFALSAPVKIP